MTENVIPFAGDPRDEPPRQKFELLWFRDILPALDAHDFVEDLLGDNQLSVVYGESNCGKTFFALDLALHLAQGLPWFARETRPCGVVYVALEGGHGIRNRITAFKTHHGLDDATLPLAVIAQPVRLLDPGADTQSVIDAVAVAARTIEGTVGLIIFDTLSRALSGGNENDSEDMGALVRHADLIRKATGSHVMFIHHSGKNVLAGARGHSLLRAATDTEIEVSRDDETKISTASVTKQRELETAGRFSFRLQPMEVGRTPRGKPVNSCVVEPLDTPMEPRRKDKQKPLNVGAKIAFAALSDLVLSHGTIPAMNQHIPANTKCVSVAMWRETVYGRSVADAKPETQRKAFKRATDELLERGSVAIWQSLVWIATKQKVNNG